LKHLLLIGDGMADFPLDELGGRTPLEAAATPAMDRMAREGILGHYCPIPDDLPPGSDIGNLSLFGYDPHEAFSGRAPLEAARRGIRLAPDQVAFRCNLVTLADGLMANFTADHIPSDQAAELIEALNAALDGFPARFHAGVGYRHLTMITGEGGIAPACAQADCTPPHNIPEQLYAGHLPKGPGAELLVALMERSQEVLPGHPVNKARVAAGKLPATSIWLWGQGTAPRMKGFEELYGLTGAVISAVDLVNGIGVCAGLEVVEVPGATGYLDTDYEGKVAGALDALERHDLAIVHIEAPDETGHEGRTDKKIQAIEDFDRRVVAPCLEYALARGDCRVMAAPDHVTAISTRTHAGGPVPFVMAGAGVASSGCPGYSEKNATATGIVAERGYLLVRHFFQSETITRENVSGL
jgi:2,3-bisphosphoglycerate-independent phosphoglycerate mutase